ncbi:MAG: glycosyltransferase family 2 protein [Acidobacteriaceae bacterium]|nr:glycosyltransferase family 2 protein [Acidobacteriaceae bacterium]
MSEEEVGEALQRLRDEQKATQRQLGAILELLEKHENQIAAQETSVARLDRILMEILTGRTWRTLRAAGDLIRKLTPARGGGASVSRSGKRSYLMCDEPRPGDRKARTGIVAIKGWCVAEGGVDCVRISIAGIPQIETTPSLPRPDVKKNHPDLDSTGRAGFAAEFDSTPLAKGRHTITLRLISRGAVIRETKTAVNIDHDKGFASDYQRWIREFEAPDDKLMELKLTALQRRPLISVIMPVYNTVATELKEAIESVLAQSYENWELCISDDASPEPHAREIASRFSEGDSRIKTVFRRERGGISQNSNSALELAKGEYVCFLDHDDTLARHALAHICEALERNAGAELIYSDEDKIDRAGTRFDPFFKPDWSPDLLLSENYICHMLVLRRDLLEKAGSFRSECDGSQDYDLILRATEKAANIAHIPKVLYHWRAGVASTASGIENKNYAISAANQALSRHSERVNGGLGIEPGGITGRWRARYPIPEGTRVSIIIAAGGKVDVLRTNIESIFSKTTYRDYEVLVIDNSRNDGIEKLVNGFRGADHALRYIDWRNRPFNYSLINNTAARQCDSPVLLFLNDDTSVIAPGWLEAMTELAMRPEVGAVGAKLLYPNGRIQHAGVVMGLYDNCGHAFKGLDGKAGHYFDFSDVIRNVSAVTGACLMTRASVFRDAGGFDETEFAVAFNDIDLCLKIGALGYRVLYTPYALLYHHEAFSKTSKDLIPHPREVDSMRAKWAKVIGWDPYYSPNLTRNDEDYSLRTRDV